MLITERPTKLRSIEFLKWLALGCMLLDHINTFLLNMAYEPLYVAGRIAAPVFIIVLACNLGGKKTQTTNAVIARLTTFACIAAVPHALLIAGFFPMNIMFTLLIMAFVIKFITERSIPQIASVLVILYVLLTYSEITEFSWAAIGLGVSVWSFAISRGVATKSAYLIVAVFFLYQFSYFNGNYWSLLAVPIIAVSHYLNITLPRIKYLFYVAYPLHLFLIVVARTYLESKGYWFL